MVKPPQEPEKKQREKRDTKLGRRIAAGGAVLLAGVVGVAGYTRLQSKPSPDRPPTPSTQPETTTTLSEVKSIPAPSIEGLLVITDQESGQTKYIAQVDNPFGLTEGTEAGVFKPNVFSNINPEAELKQTGGIVLSPEVTKFFLKEMNTSDEPSKGIVTVAPVDITNSQEPINFVRDKVNEVPDADQAIGIIITLPQDQRVDLINPWYEATKISQVPVNQLLHKWTFEANIPNAQPGDHCFSNVCLPYKGLYTSLFTYTDTLHSEDFQTSTDYEQSSRFGDIITTVQDKVTIVGGTIQDRRSLIPLMIENAPVFLRSSS